MTRRTTKPWLADKHGGNQDLPQLSAREHRNPWSSLDWHRLERMRPFRTGLLLLSPDLKPRRRRKRLVNLMTSLQHLLDRPVNWLPLDLFLQDHGRLSPHGDRLTPLAIAEARLLLQLLFCKKPRQQKRCHPRRQSLLGPSLSSIRLHQRLVDHL